MVVRRQSRKNTRKRSKFSYKDLEECLAIVRKIYSPFRIELDLTMVPVHFTAHVLGRARRKEDELSIKTYDTSGSYVRPLGVVRIRRADWVKFKKVGNELLSGHARVARKIKATKA